MSEEKVAATRDAAELLEIEGQAMPSRRNRAWRRFRRNKLAVVSVVFIVVMLLATFPLAPVLTTAHPHKIDLSKTGQPPGPDNLLGTDLTGRDVWSRLVYGGRASMAVGLVAVVIYMSIGITVGSIAGYYGRWVDSVLMRITDAIHTSKCSICRMGERTMFPAMNSFWPFNHSPESEK